MQRLFVAADGFPARSEFVQRRFKFSKLARCRDDGNPLSAETGLGAEHGARFGDKSDSNDSVMTKISAPNTAFSWVVCVFAKVA